MKNNNINNAVINPKNDLQVTKSKNDLQATSTNVKDNSYETPIKIESSSESSVSSYSDANNYVDKLDENFNKIQDLINNAVSNQDSMMQEINKNKELIEKSKTDEQKVSKDIYDLDSFKQKENEIELSTMAERLIMKTENNHLKKQVELLDQSSEIIENASKDLTKAKHELKNLLDYRDTLTEIRVLETKGIEGKYTEQDERKMNELIDLEKEKFASLKQKNMESSYKENVEKKDVENYDKENVEKKNVENYDKEVDEKEQERIDKVKQMLQSGEYENVARDKRKLEESSEEREPKKLNTNQDKTTEFQDSSDITSEDDPMDIFWED